MRRRIRLTGRRQLSRACVIVQFADLGGRRLLTFSLQPGEFDDFPSDARVSVRLFENKMVEVVEFGTLGSPKATAELKNQSFVAPSCELRVTASSQDKRGLLLGSTEQWTLRADDEPEDQSSESILLFLPKEISPLTWELDIRDNEYPVVYIDKQIPDARTWARGDLVFTATALPSIIRRIFDKILDEENEETEIKWMQGWLHWADMVMPGNIPPFDGSDDEKSAWIDTIIQSFSRQHRFLDKLVRKLNTEKVPA